MMSWIVVSRCLQGDVVHDGGESAGACIGPRPGGAPVSVGATGQDWRVTWSPLVVSVTMSDAALVPATAVCSVSPSVEARPVVPAAPTDVLLVSWTTRDTVSPSARLVTGPTVRLPWSPGRGAEDDVDLTCRDRRGSSGLAIRKLATTPPMELTANVTVAAVRTTLLGNCRLRE